MTALNAAVETGRATFEQAARSFLRERGDAARASLPEAGGWRWLWVSTLEHLTLVVVSLALSCLIGIPCGILAFRRPRLGGMLVVISALLQTIPTLALLCFLIPLLGIGSLPTIAALFLYGLLPIVQSTCSGLLSLDPRLTETAVILGLTPTERLLRVELPLASVNILAGVKTTAVINVATAAIAALIGAGGYGRFITAGLAMNDTATILRGAIPTAAMAVAVHLFFNLLGRFVVPRGLRR
jgi:osmoprotectant transport system permease protein